MTTVKELIEKLQAMPEDSLVYIANDVNRPVDLDFETNIVATKITRDAFGESWHKFAVSGENSQPAVCITNYNTDSRMW